MLSLMRMAVTAAVLLAACAASATGQTYSGKVSWLGVGPVTSLRLTLCYIDSSSPAPWKIGGYGMTDAQGAFTIRTTSFPGNAASPWIEGYANVPVLDARQWKVAKWVSLSGGSNIKLDIPRPAFLVHDLFDTPASWSIASTALSVPGRTGPGTTVAFAPCISVSLPQSWSRSHIDNAKLLDAEIKKARAGIFQAIGGKVAPIGVNLVGHGAGGLTARAYVANHAGGPGEETVDKCITIGSPHLGTVWLQLLPPGHGYFKASPCLTQMRADYMLQQFPAQLRGGYGPTRFYLLGGSANQNPAEPEIVPGWPYDKNDDGYVSTYSATSKNWGGKVVATEVEPYFYRTAPSHRWVINRLIIWFLAS